MSATDEGLIFKDETYAIIGAAMEVHKNLGCGFLESVYQEALSLELAKRAIPFIEEPGLEISYKGITLKKHYRPDFVVFGKIIVELKAQDRIRQLEEMQLVNYLKSTCFEVGILINFGGQSLQWKRKVLTKKESVVERISA